MKKLLFSLLLTTSFAFCDTKISALPSTTTLNSVDIIPVVTNPSTNPQNFSISKSNLVSTLGIPKIISGQSQFIARYNGSSGSTTTITDSLASLGNDGTINAGTGEIIGSAGIFSPNGVSTCGGAGCVSLVAPAALTPSGGYTLKFSSSQGGINTILNNDGSGNLSWISNNGGGSGSGIVSPGTFTWQNNFGMSASTMTVSTLTVTSSISSPLTVNQKNTGVVESDFYLDQLINPGSPASFRKLWYGNALPTTFNEPLIISAGSTTGATLNLDGGGSVGLNGLQFQTTFYVNGNVQIGSGATASGASLAPVDGLYVKGATILNSTATVAALSFSGDGNAQFSNDGVNFGQIVQSSAAVTVGHYAGFSSSWQVVDIGTGTSSGVGGVPSVNSNANAAITSSVTLVSGANVTLTQAGNTIAIAASGGNPSGGNFDVQVSSNGAFGGSDNLQNNGSTITISNVSAMTQTNVSSQVATGIYFDYSASTMVEPSLLGRTNGATPSAGMVGQYISSSAINATAFPSTTNFGDLAAIVLTAGDWDISAVLGSQANGGTVTTMAVGISSTTGNSSAGLIEGDSLIKSLGPTAATDTFGSIPNVQASITTTTTYYLKFESAFSIATPKAVGRISARRKS